MNKKIFVVIIILTLLIIRTTIFIIYNKNDKGNEYAAVNIYTDLIDKILENNTLKELDFISIDTKSLKDPLNNNLISENLQLEIIEYCKKYNDNIYKKDDIRIQNITLNGITISFSITQKKKEQNTH